MSRSRLRRSLPFIPLMFALALSARAVNPPPDGGYANSNTAEGEDALFSVTNGSNDTAIGFNALFTNTTGIFNTAVGAQALLKNKRGNSNTATGFAALSSNTIGEENTADGAVALGFNTRGNFNTAEGSGALGNNTAGNSNTAIGANALARSLDGDDNIAVGESAGENISRGSNNIDIGNFGVEDESNKIRIGTQGTHKNTFIAGISGTTVPNGVAVIVGINGKLGTIVSSARFKDGIKPMDQASEAILALKPVTFRYKHELDPDCIPQFGLVAEEVEKVNPDLVARDEQGKPYTVRYEAINAMLLNEFLKEHRKVESQNKRVEQLEATVTRLESALETQAAQIQKVTTHLDMKNSPVPMLARD